HRGEQKRERTRAADRERERGGDREDPAADHRIDEAGGEADRADHAEQPFVADLVHDDHPGVFGVVQDTRGWDARPRRRCYWLPPKVRSRCTRISSCIFSMPSILLSPP